MSVDYPKIVRAIKYNFSIKISQDEEQSMVPLEMNKILEYMQNNPLKHELIENLNEWRYSSFA